MKTELKDVAHLYVGQRMLSWWGDIQEKQVIKGVIGNHVVFRYSEDDGIQDSLDLSYKQKKGKEPKLILRPLSDMTKEEKDQAFVLSKADEIVYLLKCGFDLFGLIESGQAIDKTKM